jgi:DNA-binding response OmpR family regulator
LAENEPIIAADLRYILERKGCQVLEIDDFDGINALCNKHLPDLAILNFHGNNPQKAMLFARDFRVRYMMKILFITGARSKDIWKNETFYAGNLVLFKPFTRVQLRTALEEILP